MMRWVRFGIISKVVEAVGLGDDAAVAVMVQLPVEVKVTAPVDELTEQAPDAE